MGIAHAGKIEGEGFVAAFLLCFIIVIIGFVIYNCSIGIEAKKFMVNHPEIKFQRTNYGPIYDKYTSTRTLRNLRLHNEIITVYVEQKKYEIFLETSWFGANPKRIGDTNYGIYSMFKGVKFQVMKPIKIKPPIESEQIIQKKKENIKMDLSIGTWIILIIIMIIVAKIAHKISLKTIFKPTKKASKHIKKEWDES